MKTINTTFTDKEHLELRKIKNDVNIGKSWHDFILRSARFFKKMKGGAKDGRK